MIDGKSASYLNDVQMHYEVPDDDGDLGLSVKLTPEGIIIDVTNADGEVIETQGWTADEMLWSILG